MRSNLVRCSLLLILPAFAFAQSEDIHHNNVTVGLGAAIPVGSAQNYLSTAPLVSVGYGYRLNRLFQADAGIQFAFGAANNTNPEATDLGTVQGGDREYMIPLGGRIYIPMPFKRMEFSVGGGAMHLHYSESVPSSAYSYYPNSCYSCTSRGGWGGYGLASARYYLDSNHNFHVGTTLQFISATTNGQPVGDVPALSTTDHWTNVGLEFGLSF
jgi:hypothetical protein